MKRILLLVLALLLCITVVSCSEKKDSEPEITLPKGYVLGYGDTYVSESFFLYEVMMYKMGYLGSVMGLDGDMKEIWSEPSKEEGVTKGEAILNIALEECFAIAWTIDWGKKNGIEITEEDQIIMKESVAADSQQYGGYENLIAAMAELGFTEEEYLAINELLFLYDKSMTALTSQSGGEYEITQDEINKYLEENFVAVKHVYVNNVAEIGEDGSTYVQIGQETYKEKMEKADKIEKALNEGNDFDLLYSMSDDGMQAVYPNGMLITMGDVASPEYEDACFELEIGDWKRIDLPMYGIYFIKRVEMPEDLVAQRIIEVPYYMRTDIQHKIWEDHKDDFIANSEYVSSVNVAEIPVG